MRRAQTAEEELQAAEPALQEKNAIFSAWLMRRIGASGSLAGTAGFRNMPLAMMVEPSDIPIGGAGAGEMQALVRALVRWRGAETVEPPAESAAPARRPVRAQSLA